MSAAEPAQTAYRDDIERAAEALDGQHPEEIVAWAIQTYHPAISLASSFGLEDVALIHMAAQVRSDANVFYLDTGFLFPETYDTIDRITSRYSIALEQVLPKLTVAEQARVQGEALWARDPDLCCHLRKVEPLERTLAKLKAWITGIRRDQTPSRAHTRVVEWDDRHGLVKVNPLAAWTAADVRAYVSEHDIPYNPMHDKGYPSIGCSPCTRKVLPGEDPRAGRWAGFTKTECGLHFDK